MMTKFKSILMVLALSSSVLFTACKDDDSEAILNPNAPTVTSTIPESDASEVERNTTITFVFSEEMDVTTINENTFSLKQGNNTISGSIAFAGKTGVFTPTESLAAGTIYAASIGVTAQNITGTPLNDKVEWNFTTGGSTASINVVDLGTSGNYVILAKTAINNSPTSSITGDIGISPAATSYITGLDLVDDMGFATSTQITGRAYAADMTSPTSTNLTTAVDNMNTAYNDAAGRTSPDFVELHAGDLSGKTLVPGVYKWTNNVIVSTDMQLSGSDTDVWIFQVDGNLTLSAAVIVGLSGGAKAENIFWQIAGEVTIRTTAQMKGVILSKTGITLETGAVLNGRALAQTAVILDANVVTQP